jgi:hypothetical protein
MPIGTHLGPWLLGTTKNTTGNTAALTRNTGATVVAQTSLVDTFNSTDLVATGIWIPAGARFSYFIIEITEGQFFYDNCSGNGAMSLYLRDVAVDSGAKNSRVTASVNDTYFATFANFSNSMNQYFRLVSQRGENINSTRPNANNMSQGVNTDRQVWLSAFSSSDLPTKVRVTVAYMVRNTDTTYQPSSTTGP